jgi:hypothetical protein
VLTLAPEWESIKAEQIAKAMVYFSKTDAKGILLHESDELHKV